MQRIIYFVIFAIFPFINGCQVFNGWSDRHDYSTYSSYNDLAEESYSYDEGTSHQKRRNASVDGERPVQMTPIDNQLKTVQPELKPQKPQHHSNKKVLLPISGGVE